MEQNTLIVRDEMFVEILKACPSFEPKWRAFVEEYEDEAELPLYWALHLLAKHLIGMMEAGEESGLRTVFEIVENWLLNGDPYVKEAALIGLLEDLQNAGIYKGTATRNDFLRFLHPTSKDGWDELMDFWEPSNPVVEDQ